MFVVTYARGSKEHVDAQQERMVRSLQPEDTVVGSYSDLTNGMDTARHGLTAAMEHLAAGGVQGLCVSSLDRLARRADQLADITQWCRDNGFDVREVSDVPEGQ